jgi:ribosomal protein L23
MGSGRGAYRPDWKKAIVALKPGQEIRAGEELK